MAKRSGEDPRLARLTRICAALPEFTREEYGEHARFVVRKKTFAYYLDNYHGDGRVAVTCKASPGQNEAFAESDPERFYIPAYVGPQGWVAFRLDMGRIDWELVAELVASSYRLVAPKRLAAGVETPPA